MQLGYTVYLNDTEIRLVYIHAFLFNLVADPMPVDTKAATENNIASCEDKRPGPASWFKSDGKLLLYH